MDELGLYHQSVPLVHPVPTVHAIPLYHGTEWTDWDCTKVSHLLHPVPAVHPIPMYPMPLYPIWYSRSLLSIPSHCTMGRNGQTGIIPKCPTCYTLYLLSIPSHCTMGRNGRTGIIPRCPTCTPCPYCPSHPIPLYHGMAEWTDCTTNWECNICIW